jgi:broad specificity phosphatase PhoE
MACSSYKEVAAVFDRMYASPADRALPVADAFAELAAEAGRAILPEVARPDPEPGP